jgi:hypothetical protein
MCAGRGADLLGARGCGVGGGNDRRGGLPDLASQRRTIVAHATMSLRAELVRSACQRFTTVLGPGKYHENNIHLDLLQRRGGYRICQWEVR